MIKSCKIQASSAFKCVQFSHTNLVFVFVYVFVYFVLRILEDDQRMQNTFSGKCTQLSAAEYAEINGAPKMNEYTS